MPPSASGWTGAAPGSRRPPSTASRPHCAGRTRRWRSSSRGRSRTPTRSGWSATTGCARPHLAPTPALAAEIRDTQQRVADFAARVHDGRVRPPDRRALPPPARDRHRRLRARPAARGRRPRRPERPPLPHFLDNTDPDGIDRVLSRLGERLAETIAVVISKSGGTPETRNGMVETTAAYAARGLDFAKHAVAITQEGSALDRQAVAQGLLARFPMWDWVGGRTSVTSAVGLLPAALQGIDIAALLAGAAAMDEATRRPRAAREPGGAPRRRVARARRGPRLEGDGRPALQGSPAPLLALPAAARHGVAREGEGPRGPRRPPGAHRLRQQGLDGPARVRAAAARRRRRLLRDLRPSPARPRRGRASRSSPGRRAATSSTAFSWARAARSSRTAVPRSRSRSPRSRRARSGC